MAKFEFFKKIFWGVSHKNPEICPKCVKIPNFLARFLKRVIEDLKFKKKLKLAFLAKI